MNARHFALGIVALFLVSNAFGETKCKASPVKNPIAVEYTNFDLEVAGERIFEGDCIAIVEDMLVREMLPEVNGIRVPVRLVYSLTNQNLFPTIARLLTAARGGMLKLAVTFTVGEDDEPGEMTSFTLVAADRPPPFAPN